MNNKDKARLIIDRLNEKGADLGNASWGIVEQVLNEIDAQAYDPYMPTDAEWAAHPKMKFAATDDDGGMYAFTRRPVYDDGAWWYSSSSTLAQPIKQVTPPADYRNTLRYRPEGI